MKTQPLYLDDSYLKSIEATVVDVIEESPGKWRIILDKTVFYPMGGGQATDQGILKGNNWLADVYQVMMKDGEIWHYISSNSAPSVGLQVTGEINWERRYKNMRLHSAGHIVDFSIYLLGYSPSPLIPFKGDHSKKPHIVYQGTVNKDIQQEIENKVHELVQENKEFTWLFQPYEKLQKEAIYLQPGLPTNKPLRTLRLEGVGAVADGGTQVKKTSEVGKIVITAVEEIEGNTIVRYGIE